MYNGASWTVYVLITATTIYNVWLNTAVFFLFFFKHSNVYLCLKATTYSTVPLILWCPYRYQTQKTKTACAMLHAMWSEFKNGDITAKVLCQRAGNLNFVVKMTLKETVSDSRWMNVMDEWTEWLFVHL